HRRGTVAATGETVRARPAVARRRPVDLAPRRSISRQTAQRRGGHSMPKTTQRITPFLWFDSQAEEAANFYVSIFKQSRIGAITRYDDEGSKAAGRPKGSVMTGGF